MGYRGHAVPVFIRGVVNRLRESIRAQPPEKNVCTEGEPRRSKTAPSGESLWARGAGGGVFWPEAGVLVRRRSLEVAVLVLASP